MGAREGTSQYLGPLLDQLRGRKFARKDHLDLFRRVRESHETNNRNIPSLHTEQLSANLGEQKTAANLFHF